MKIKRGEVWYCKNFGNGLQGIISGPRPVLIISNDKFNLCSPVVNILGVSGQHKESPVHFGINLDVKSYVNCEQIYTVNKSWLTKKMATLDEHQMLEIENLLMLQLHL